MAAGVGGEARLPRPPPVAHRRGHPGPDAAGPRAFRYPTATIGHRGRGRGGGGEVPAGGAAPPSIAEPPPAPEPPGPTRSAPRPRLSGTGGGAGGVGGRAWPWRGLMAGAPRPSIAEVLFRLRSGRIPLTVPERRRRSPQAVPRSIPLPKSRLSSSGTGPERS